MSDQIQVFYELEVLDGKSEELREIAQQMVAFNEQGEPETLVYNVYMSDDGKLTTFLGLGPIAQLEYFMLNGSQQESSWPKFWNARAQGDFVFMAMSLTI